LLFPVISASDDEQAVKQEVEEPAPSKRSVRQISTGRHDNFLPFTAGILGRVPGISRLDWVGDVTLLAENPLTINLPEILSGRAPPAFRA
jgi:hypothetical protein